MTVRDDEEIASQLRHAKVGMNGSAEDRWRAKAILEDLCRANPQSLEAGEARRILQMWRPSQAIFDEADGVYQLEQDWDGITQATDVRLQDIVTRAFDPSLVEGERLGELRRTIVEFLAAEAEKLTGLAMLRHYEALFRIVMKAPAWRAAAADALGTVSREAFRQRLAASEPVVVAALELWDTETAQSELDRLGIAPDSFADRIGVLRRQIAQAAYWHHRLEQARDSLSSPIVQSPEDAAVLAAALDEIDFVVHAVAVPAPFLPPLAGLGNRAVAAVKRWAEETAAKARTIDDLQSFARLWKRVPVRWHDLERAAWFEAGWAISLDRLRNAVASAASRNDLQSVTAGFSAATAALPGVLQETASAIVDGLTALAAAWHEAEEGRPGAEPDLPEPFGRDTLPSGYTRQRQDAEARERRVEDALRRLEQAEDAGDLAGLLRLEHEFEGFGRHPRAMRARERAGIAAARLQAREALGRWDVDGAVTFMTRADPSLGPARQKALRENLDALSILVAWPVEAGFAWLANWWSGWANALRSLDEGALLPPGLDLLAVAEMRTRQEQLSRAIDSVLADRTLSATDLFQAAGVFDPLGDWPPLRAEADRLRLRAATLAADAAISARDRSAAQTAFAVLEDAGEDPERLTTLALHLDLACAAPVDRLGELLLWRWQDAVTRLPAETVAFALDALRSRRAAGCEPTALDEGLAQCLRNTVEADPAFADNREDVAFWCEWLDLLRALGGTETPSAEILAAATARLRSLSRKQRASVQADLRRLTGLWKDRRDWVLLIWAAGAFGRDKAAANRDSLERLRLTIDEDCAGAVRDLSALEVLEWPAAMEARRVVLRCVERWDMAQRVLAMTDPHTTPSPPRELERAVAVTGQLDALTLDWQALSSIDFRSPKLAEAVARVEARIVAILDGQALPGVVRLRSTLERLASAGAVGDLWREFSDHSHAMRERDTLTAGANDRIAKLVDEMRQVLRKAGADSLPGAAILCRDVARTLVEVNPGLDPAETEGGLDDLAETAFRLCREEQHVRAELVMIDGKLPRNGIRDPGDPRHDPFFKAFPAEPPAGLIARRRYQMFLLRDPMPQIIARAGGRLPLWVRTLPTPAVSGA